MGFGLVRKVSLMQGYFKLYTLRQLQHYLLYKITSLQLVNKSLGTPSTWRIRQLKADFIFFLSLCLCLYLLIYWWMWSTAFPNINKPTSSTTWMPSYHLSSSKFTYIHRLVVSSMRPIKFQNVLFLIFFCFLDGVC